MRTQLLLSILICLAALRLPAQDLHIYCDAFSDSIFYQRNGKLVENAMVRKGDQIILHIRNYNNYPYNIELETENKNLTLAEGQYGKGFAPSSAGASPFSMLLKSVGGGFPGLPDLFGGGNDNFGFAGNDGNAEQASQIAKKVAEFRKNLKYLEQTDTDLAALESKLEMSMAAQKMHDFSIEEINRLRYDPNLEPAQIKRMTQEYAQQIFQESNPENLTLQYVLDRSNARSDVAALISDYRLKVNRYDRFHQKIAGLSEELQQFSVPNNGLDPFVDSTFLISLKGAEKLDAYQQNLVNLEKPGSGRQL
ncbi:MAG: hypothetical protein IPL65_08765 [Lewinellaceae bacterium]|nr:hypothetical protein [Lewinellaceae bacterium]